MEQKAEHPMQKRAELLSAMLFNSTVDRRVELILQAFKKVAEAQKNRDRAVYSINRTKTSIEIRDAMLKAPLVTHSATRRAAK